MIKLFKRTPVLAAPDAAALGKATLAQRMPQGAIVPQGCTGVVVNKDGVTRRVLEGGRLASSEHESAFCFHPGPYDVELTPFAAAPELGLHLAFVVDGPDPRVAQQRFDLYLASEGGDSVQVSAFAAAIEAALQRELTQGNLELAPCTSIDEWDAFRAGLNQLLYQRFGITVDDCVPVDLGDRVDYAQMLLARAAAAPVIEGAKDAASTPAAHSVKLADALALRRLFLELPSITSALRLIALPPGQVLFRQHQELLARLDHVSLLFETMPALELEAPGRALDATRQSVRAEHSNAAVSALDEAWSLLARFAGTTQFTYLFEDADRIVANLEHHGAQRRETA